MRRTGTARPPARYRDADGYPLGTWTWLRRQMYRRGRLPADQVAALEQLPGWSWDPLSDHFTTGVRLLTAFAREQGHVFVPEGQTEDGFPLASWGADVRALARAGKLTPDRRRVVEAIPHWATTRQRDYSRDVERLRQYQEGHGHLRISPSGPAAALGSRAQGLREQYAQGRLPQDVVAALEEIPGWSWTPKADRWARGLAAFQVFSRQAGHGRVPDDYHHGGVHLRAWVRQQRVRYAKGELEPERITMLEREAHWTWAPEKRRWAIAVDALKAFVRREGHAQPPKGAVQCGVHIGTWAVTVRKRYREGRLTPRQVHQLEQLRGWSWQPRPSGWWRGIEAFRAFVAREGHARIPGGHRERGVNLPAWTTTQRRRHRQGRLSGEEIRELEASPQWTWDPVAKRWAAAIRALEAFAQREGHCRPPRGHRERGLNLLDWIANVRRQYRQGRLTAQQIRQLDNITSWSWGRAARRKEPRCA